MHQAIATIPGHKSAISDVKFFHAPPSRDRERYPLTEVPRAFDAMDAFSGAGAGVGAGAGAGANGEAKKEEGEGTSEEAKPDVYAPGDDSRPDFPVSGSFLVSSGFDGYVKVWSADDWQQVRAMANDEAGKVMSVDVSSGASFPPREGVPALTDKSAHTEQTRASSLRGSTTRRSNSTRTPTSTLRSL